jgi:hypothetical protein
MVHPEQTNESVGFVGGVELRGQRDQYRCLLVRKKKKTYIIVAVRETTPPKCAHDAVWAFTTKCTGAVEIEETSERISGLTQKSDQKDDGCEGQLLTLAWIEKTLRDRPYAFRSGWVRARSRCPERLARSS